MSDLTSKTCTRCRTPKPVAAFSKDPGAHKGLRSYCRQCVSDRDAARYRLSGRADLLVRRYGVSLEEYELLLEEQAGRCRLCGTAEPKGRWSRFVVDHCHTTGRVRGLLCSPCNSALGALGDSPEALLRAYRYAAGTEFD